MPDRDEPIDDDVPIAELADEPAPRARPDRERPDRQRRGPPAAVVVVTAVGSLVVAGLVLAAVAVAPDNGPARRTTASTVSTVSTVATGDERARRAVLAAVRTTISYRNFNMTFRLGQAPGNALPPGWECYRADPSASYCAAAGPGVAIEGHGTISIDPPGMVSTATVGGIGEVTTWVNGTTVWERGGGNYGMGAGAPLPGFASLVTGTLGVREGSVAMMSLAGPLGYLDLAAAAITGASELGQQWADGVLLTEYEVTIDAAKLTDRPEMTPEQRAASGAAFTALAREGYVNTTERVAIDDAGLVRRSRTVVRFVDGGDVTADATFSDFGRAHPIAMP